MGDEERKRRAEEFACLPPAKRALLAASSLASSQSHSSATITKPPATATSAPFQFHLAPENQQQQTPTSQAHSTTQSTPVTSQISTDSLNHPAPLTASQIKVEDKHDVPAVKLEDIPTHTHSLAIGPTPNALKGAIANQVCYEL